MIPFPERLAAAQAKAGSRLCVGLDPDPERLPSAFSNREAADVVAFCREIIEATHHVAAAYKPNLAFFEALGGEGWTALQEVVDSVPEPCLVIGDGKRGDIGNTAHKYAASIFEALKLDAATVAPYMGMDSVDPFLAYPGRAAFVLVHTSNPGADDFQTLLVDGRPLYEVVADAVVARGSAAAGTAGFVVGGTRPERLRRLREHFPNVPFLIPGVGAQGGTPELVMAAAGSGPMVVNASRAIMYASSGRDYAMAARQVAERLAEGLPYK